MAINWSNIEAANNSVQITALNTAMDDQGNVGKGGDFMLSRLPGDTWEVLKDTFKDPSKAAQIGLKLAENKDLGQIETYLKNNGKTFNAADYADDLSSLEKSGQLDNFLNRLATDPAYKTQLAETLKDNPAGVSAIIAQHNAPTDPQQDANTTGATTSEIPEYLKPAEDTTDIDSPSILFDVGSMIGLDPTPPSQPDAQPPYRLDPERPPAQQASGSASPQREDTQQNPSGTSEPTAADFEALMEISEFLAEHEAANPQDAGLVEHFMNGIMPGDAQDPKLIEALKAFKANNGDMLKGGGDGDDLMAGFMDKDAMIHDLLDSYKKTPDKAYEALANPNFQTEAFMQYSSIGQAVSMIATPILNWLGSLFGQDSTLSGWAQMDFSAIMQDFQSFFNGGMNNAMAMSNNDMSLTGAISTVFNVGIGAGQDALEMTRYDRQYTQDNPNTPVQNTVALIQDDGTVDTITLGDAPDSNAEQNAAAQRAAELQLQQQRDNQNNLNNTTQQPAGPPQ